MRLAVIGGGTMGEAMIGGLVRGGVAKPDEIVVGEPLADRRALLKERYGVKAVESNLEAASGGELVVLAVKPQSLPEVLAQLRSRFQARQTVLSIIAGARLNVLVEGLGHPTVIRVMPNTPAQIGAGMSVWTATSKVSPEARQATQALLRTLGEELYVSEERYLDMATALNGSGPAYVFQFAEALIDAGVYLGLSRDVARLLVSQTLLGSAKLMLQSGRHPAELREMVTSPGGTTAEALLALEQAGFRAAVMGAVIAAYEKSQALGEEA